MITSMTGYGKAVAELPGKKVTIEIRSLNSKQLDITIKLPGAFREKETDVRNWLSKNLERGKIELFATSEISGDSPNFSINKPLARSYFIEFKELAKELNEDLTGNILPLILKMPDVLQTNREEIDVQEWLMVMDTIVKATDQMITFRTGEGKILENDILPRLAIILDLLASIEPFEANRLNLVKERLQKALANLPNTGNGPGSPDPNRFEQELIYYLEKFDITEEKVRLKKHCDYFLETITEPVSQGKKLGFIIQEMGREINTIGSKANDATIQKIVVQMKDELEKIKEQLLNIL
ncbi:MAG: YicC family protein [Bacteroidetes bacterium]|nr:YicC family protein [Bacteroidota bacterium]